MLDSVQYSTRRNQAVSFVFGVVLVIFLGLAGIGVERTTDIVELSSPVITVVRAASLGLGTGYYLGASFKSGNKSRQWVLFGAFSTLTIWAGITIETQLLWRLPASALIPLGALLSILAHLTPAIQNKEDYKTVFRWLSGMLTTFVVVLLGTIEFIITLLQKFWSWLSGFTFALAAIIGGLVILVIGITLGASFAESED